MANHLHSSNFLQKWYPAVIVPLLVLVWNQHSQNMKLDARIDRLTSEKAALEKALDDCRKCKKIGQPPQPISPIPSPAITNAEIKFDQIPSRGGGAESRGTISGRIVEVENPNIYKMVIYAQTDHWYVQPLGDAPFTEIKRDGTWSNWTHLGDNYAAILVTPSYRPGAVIDALPVTGEEVLAVATVPAVK